VDTFWDLGYFDNVAIWLAQSIGFEFRFIDFIQGSQQSLQYYLRELQSRPYVYGTDCLPWDGGTPSLQTGRSIRDQLIAAGRRVKVMPQPKVDQGITAARTIFGKCFFDADTAQTALSPRAAPLQGPLRRSRWLQVMVDCPELVARRHEAGP
jgi:phage terminase large subunit